MTTFLTLPRLVVTQAEGPERARSARLAVGAMRWLGDKGPRITLIAKATLSFAADDGDLGLTGATIASFTDPEPLCFDRPRELTDLAGDLVAPSDFVPRKAGADVLLVGHARADASATEIPVRVAVASDAGVVFSRSFVARAPSKRAAIALREGAFGEGEAACGPRPCAPPCDETHPPDFDFSRYNAACPEQRAPSPLPAAARVELVGVRAEPVVVKLPGLAPLAFVEGTFWGERLVELACDTLLVDADRERIALVFRGDFEVINDGTEISRVVLGLEWLERPRAREVLLADLMRGAVSYAVRPEDLRPGAEPVPADDEELAMARYETWGAHAPEPRLLLEDYAALAAELAESKEGRDEKLARYGLDADRWVVEERAWLERMADDALDGDAQLAAEYGDHYVRSQDALATPDEKRRTLADYAAISVAMEATTDPLGVLDRWQMTLSQWMRLDRRMRKAAAADDAVAGELERRLDEARAEAGAPPDA